MASERRIGFLEANKRRLVAFEQQPPHTLTASESCLMKLVASYMRLGMMLADDPPGDYAKEYAKEDDLQAALWEELWQLWGLPQPEDNDPENDDQPIRSREE